MCRGSRNALWRPLHLACVHTPAHSTPAHTHGKKCSCSTSPPGPWFYQIRALSSSLPEACFVIWPRTCPGGWKGSSGPHLPPALALSSSGIVMLSLGLITCANMTMLRSRRGQQRQPDHIKAFLWQRRPAPIKHGLLTPHPLPLRWLQNLTASMPSLRRSE